MRLDRHPPAIRMDMLEMRDGGHSIRQLWQKAPYISMSWPEGYFLVYTHVHKNCAGKPENAVGHVRSIPKPRQQIHYPCILVRKRRRSALSTTIHQGHNSSAWRRIFYKSPMTCAGLRQSAAASSTCQPHGAARPRTGPTSGAVMKACQASSQPACGTPSSRDEGDGEIDQFCASPCR